VTAVAAEIAGDHDVADGGVAEVCMKPPLK
jgi:hypothetical protein